MLRDTSHDIAPDPTRTPAPICATAVDPAHAADPSSAHPAPNAGHRMSRHLTDVSIPVCFAAGPSLDADFGAALAQRALTWHQQPDESAALEAITADTPDLLHGADAAAVVTVSTSGTLQIRAAAGPIEKLHEALPRTLTPSLWTGDCPPPPMTGDQRWPVSSTIDHQAQMGSMICAPLGSGKVMFGTLLVLGFAADAFTLNSATDATTLAIRASIALGIHRQRSQRRAADTPRDVVGEAKRIVLNQRQLTAARTFTPQHTSDLPPF